MFRIFLILSIIFMAVVPNSFAYDYQDKYKPSQNTIKEVYKLNGQIEYDDNPVETIYLDENIEKPRVNIPKHSLTLPVGVLNITSNTNTPRSALARAIVNKSSMDDILPFSSSVAEKIGGFSYGHAWEQEISYSQVETTSAFFMKYDTPKRFSFATSIRQVADQNIGKQYNMLRFSPEIHITDKLTLKDNYTSYIDLPKNKNQVTIVYTPALKKYAESLKFELGLAQSYYNSGKQSSEISFSTGFKL